MLYLSPMRSVVSIAATNRTSHAPSCKSGMSCMSHTDIKSRLQMCVAADNTFLYHPREVGDEMFFIEQVSLNPKPETLNPKP